MPSIRTVELTQGSVKTALLTARDEMLPRTQRNDPLAQWVLDFDSLSLLGKAGDASPQSPFHRVKSSFFGLLGVVALEEALGLYFASLFHIGRTLRTSQESINKIKALRNRDNLQSSVTAVRSIQTGKTELEELERLSELCLSGTRYHKFRISQARKSWELWRSHVAVMRFLIEQVAAGPSNGWFTISEPAPTSFLLGIHLAAEFLASSAMGGDRASFKAVPTLALPGFLAEVESAYTTFFDSMGDVQYWNRAMMQANKALISTHTRHIPLLESGVALGRAFRGRKVWPTDGLAFFETASTRTEFIPGPTEVDFSKEILRKVTKWFIVGGRKPPLWPNVLRLAGESWVDSALRKAGVRARFVVDSFSQDLLKTSSEQGIGPIPAAEEDWNLRVNSLFNGSWMQNLIETKWGSRFLGVSRDFNKFVEACAALLSAMGYSVRPMHGRGDQSGGPGLKNKPFLGRNSRITI